MNFENIAIAIKAIKEKHGFTKKPEKGIVGEIDCPVCKTGKLHYSVAAYNGHIHAKCTTKSCIGFMM